MVHALLAHGADEQAVEAAEPARADDEQIGAFGLVAEDVGGLALAQDRGHRHAGAPTSAAAMPSSSAVWASLRNSSRSTSLGAQPLP